MPKMAKNDLKCTIFAKLVFFGILEMGAVEGGRTHWDDFRIQAAHCTDIFYLHRTAHIKVIFKLNSNFEYPFKF